MKLEARDWTARSAGVEAGGGDSQAAADRLRRLRVEIHGAVQGVGFRPFVYRLATELSLLGWVINDTEGVFIEVEGAEAALDRFLDRLPAEAPPRAIVQSLSSTWLPPVGYAQFEIRHSDNAGAKTALILPDVATCPDCLAELLDPNDRRHRYPFTNCTNCGPRFSIIEALPYDRPNTTMRRFIMCPALPGRVRQPAGSPVSRAAERLPDLRPTPGAVPARDERRKDERRTCAKPLRRMDDRVANSQHPSLLGLRSSSPALRTTMPYAPRQRRFEPVKSWQSKAWAAFT